MLDDYMILDISKSKKLHKIYEYTMNVVPKSQGLK